MTMTTATAQNSAAPARTPRRPPHVDRDGRHWEVYGSEPLIAQRSSTPPAQIDYLGIHTQRHPKRAQGQAHVVVQSSANGFSFTGWLSPERARSVSAQLLRAADRADEVAAFFAVKGGAA
ncbi:MAG: hypothetical protein K2X51_12590 [Burkholderiales bacterium]|nr:hypothetical protein [Burkholderiales bacterium]